MLGIVYFHFRVLCLFLLCSLFYNTTAAQDNLPNTQSRLKVGLVLSGGGARGAAHLGVLKVLEENHIPIDYIAGTSFGALVGGLYASGYTADELAVILKDIDWKEVLSTKAPRNKRSFRRKQDDDGFLIKFRVGITDGNLQLPSGLITPNNLRLLLRDLVKNSANVHDFDNLTIPFRAVATDLETGKAVVLNQGDLASSIVASMAVPALFPPVPLDGKLLVDGGVSNNVPVDVARSLGADILIVVDISTPLKAKSEMSSFTSVINQLNLIMTNNNAAAQLATLTGDDIIIRPDISGIGLVDFDRAGETVPKGEEAARKVLTQLKSFALSDAAWREHMQSRTLEPMRSPVIDFVKITNGSKIADEIIQSRLSVELEQPLNRDQLSEDLTKIYGTELFDEVGYRTITDAEKTGLEIRAKGRENGNTQIRFGMTLQDDFEGESGYQLSAGINKLALNSRGGELEAQVIIGDQFGLFTEFYQPLDFADRFYVFANAGTNRVNRNVMANDRSGELLSQVRISGTNFELGAGRNLGQWGTARIGLQKASNTIHGRIGVPSSLSVNADSTTLMGSFGVDTLDNVFFPHSGLNMNMEYRNSLSFLGGDSRVDTLLSSAYVPYTWGNNTLGLNFVAATSFNGQPDEIDLFPLGGFLNLTAFAPGQLTGNHGGHMGALYYRRVSGGLGVLTQTPIYVGTALEAGNVWNRRSDISLSDLKGSASLFVGADTLIGPIYLGGGIGSEGEASAFFYVGQLF